MYPPKLCPGPTIQSKSTARKAALDLVMMIMMVKVMMNTLLVITRRGLETEIIQMRSVHALKAVPLLLCISLLYVNVLPKLV